MYFIFWLILILFCACYIINRLTCAKCNCNVCLNGKTAIVTGGTAGIGYKVATILASRGCRVIIASIGDLERTKLRIIRETHNENILVKYVDLGSFESIRKFVDEVYETEVRLDILINNAAICTAPTPATDDGLNPMMQVNFLGPFLLTNLLLDLLKKSSPSRIIFTTSMAAFCSTIKINDLEMLLKNGVNIKVGMKNFAFMYADTKLLILIISNCFAEKLKGSGVTANSLHPGIVKSSLLDSAYDIIGKYNFMLNLWTTIVLTLGKMPIEGAQTTIHLALSDGLRNTTGKYFWECRSLFQPSLSKNKEFCRKLWQISSEIVHLESSEL